MFTKFVQGVGVAALVLTAGGVQAADAAKGEKVFRKCKACHKVEAGKNGVGPTLAGIVGRPVASVDGYKYSSAMTEFGAGKTWSADELNAYLENPRKHVKGTKMAFAGLKKEDQRADVIAYLETLN